MKTNPATTQSIGADQTVWLAKCAPCSNRTRLNESPAKMPMARPAHRHLGLPAAQPAKHSDSSA